LEAEAKYSSEKERIDAPSTVVVMFVEDENVVSIKDAGTGVTVTLAVDDVLEGRPRSTTASTRVCGWMLTSMMVLSRTATGFRGGVVRVRSVSV
jgi:hypothetical protein